MPLACPECKNSIRYVHEVVFRGYITAKITYNDETHRIAQDQAGIYDYRALKVYRCPVCGHNACSVDDYVVVI